MDAKKQRHSINPPVSKNTKVHILEVIGNAGIGGMENYLQEFLSHLNHDEFEVTCICPNESSFTRSLRRLGAKEVYVTPIEDDPRWRSIQMAIELSKLYGVDILHAHMPKAHVLAGIAARFVNRPMVATIHGMNVTSHELGIARAVGSHIITNCQESFTQALAMGIPANRLSLIHNGVDVNIFSPGKPDCPIHQWLQLPQETLLVGFAGRLEHEKGPDLFLLAAEYVHRRHPEVHFVVAGEGAMRQKLEKMCQERGLMEHVHFIGWNTDCTNLYRSLNVLVQTSRSDGTSLVLLEAMACGCPCVAIGVGGLPEIIEHESTGLLAGQGDWEEVGIEIIELLEEPARAALMGIAARARVEEKFNVLKNTTTTCELLRDIGTAVASWHKFSKNGLSGQLLADAATT